MMNRSLFAYEEKIMKEIEKTKFFSWKRFVKTIKLTAINASLAK